MIDFDRMNEFLNNDSNLPISEELIAAYAEGALDDYQAMQVEQILETSPEAYELLADISYDGSDVYENISFGNSMEFDPDMDINYNAMDLPDLPILSHFEESHNILEPSFGFADADSYTSESLDSEYSDSPSDVDNFFLSDSDSSSIDNESLDLDDSSDNDDMFNNLDDL
jgi:hypothetical protein